MTAVQFCPCLFVLRIAYLRLRLCLLLGRHGQKGWLACLPGLVRRLVKDRIYCGVYVFCTLEKALKGGENAPGALIRGERGKAGAGCAPLVSAGFSYPQKDSDNLFSACLIGYLQYSPSIQEPGSCCIETTEGITALESALCCILKMQRNKMLAKHKQGSCQW